MIRCDAIPTETPSRKRSRGVDDPQTDDVNQNRILHDRVCSSNPFRSFLHKKRLRGAFEPRRRSSVFSTIKRGVNGGSDASSEKSDGALVHRRYDDDFSGSGGRRGGRRGRRSWVDVRRATVLDRGNIHTESDVSQRMSKICDQKCYESGDMRRTPRILHFARGLDAHRSLGLCERTRVRDMLSDCYIFVMKR